MRKKGIDHNLIIVLTTTLVTLSCWVGFEVYRAYTKVVIPEVLQKHLLPLNPTLNTQTLDQLQNRSAHETP